jgi:cyanophycinase
MQKVTLHDKPRQVKVLALTLALASSALTLAQAGSVVVIGGALRPENKPVYMAVANLAGKDNSICVLGTASNSPARSAKFIVEDFAGYGAKALAVDITTKNAATSTGDPKVIEQLNGCNGFWFVGGDQRRITEALLPKGQSTPALAAIRARFAAGAVVAGTSAGAAVVSDPMISGGASIDTLAGGPDKVTLEAGLGFVSGVMTDQHFLKRGRFGRLAQVLAQTKLSLGAGVDEDTALVIPASGPWQVVGVSSVAIMEVPKGTSPDSLKNITISLLSNGDSYDPSNGEIKISSAGKRTLIKPGDEYLDPGVIFKSDIFGPDAAKLLLQDLVDSPEKTAFGVAFLPGIGRAFSSNGVRVSFEKTAQTQGYYGTGDGNDYSVVRVRLSITPIKVLVMPR